MSQAHQDPVVWQRAMEMTVAVHSLTEGFPRKAQGSNYDVQTQLDLSRRPQMGDDQVARRAELLHVDVGKMPLAPIDQLTAKS